VTGAGSGERGVGTSDVGHQHTHASDRATNTPPYAAGTRPKCGSGWNAATKPSDLGDRGADGSNGERVTVTAIIRSEPDWSVGQGVVNADADMPGSVLLLPAEADADAVARVG